MKRPALDALDRGEVRAVTGAALCRSFLEKIEGPPSFACVVGTTATAEIEGISAAGATPEKRRYTAALDAEFLVYGKTLTLPDIPRNPLGPPSPVVVSRAALGEMGVFPVIVDAGSAVEPRVPRVSFGGKPGRSILTGAALDLGEDFAPACRAAARMIAAANRGASWTVLAESVPGGTTTALSLLEALGHPAHGKVSSSMSGGNHDLKARVVAEALGAARLGERPAALRAAAAVGDPMQPALALMALEASLGGPTVLGGGTQMAAVYALMARLVEEGEAGDLSNVALATTRWVAADPDADLAGILGGIEPPVAAFAAWLDFSGCRSPGLRRYEEGLVKEGVGAGAAAFAALVSGAADAARLVERIERIVEEIDGQKN